MRHQTIPQDITALGPRPWTKRGTGHVGQGEQCGRGGSFWIAGWIGQWIGQWVGDAAVVDVLNGIPQLQRRAVVVVVVVVVVAVTENVAI